MKLYVFLGSSEFDVGHDHFEMGLGLIPDRPSG